MQTEQLKIRSNLKAIHELKLWFAINLIGIGITEWHQVSIELASDQGSEISIAAFCEKVYSPFAKRRPLQLREGEVLSARLRDRE